jgi:1-acyl-sn-glycerol-3-phosphate acyltransferase
MHYRSLFSLTPGRSRIVYLEEIPVAGLTVKDLPLLRDKVWQQMAEKLRAYKASWIR